MRWKNSTLYTFSSKSFLNPFELNIQTNFFFFFKHFTKFTFKKIDVLGIFTIRGGLVKSFTLVHWGLKYKTYLKFIANTIIPNHRSVISLVKTLTPARHVVSLHFLHHHVGNTLGQKWSTAPGRWALSCWSPSSSPHHTLICQKLLGFEGSRSMGMHRCMWSILMKQ